MIAGIPGFGKNGWMDGIVLAERVETPGARVTFIRATEAHI